MNFCSECKYANLVEYSSGIKIFCTRQDESTRLKEGQFNVARNVCKRLTATACAYFTEKDVSEDC